MKVLGVTQGRNLEIFLNLMTSLEAGGDTRVAGAFVSDSGYFKKLHKSRARLSDPAFPLEKEWEVVTEGLRTVPDLEVIRAYEHEVGEPAWHALLADRRVFFGRYSKRVQDYAPRFTDRQMLGILTAALRRIDALLARSEPDVILAFGTATFGDYLLGRLAWARGYRYLQLKSTKILNYVALNDHMTELSAHIAAPYRNADVSAEARQIARDYMTGVREQGVKYEGAIKLNARLNTFKLRYALPKLARAAVLEARRQSDPVERNDTHLDGYLMPALLETTVQPWRAFRFRKRYGGEFLSAEDLASYGRFAFFPLHFEPEVSIQVFGRPYQNQIEVVRALALSLPADVPLVLKEHPRAIGFRPLRYYEKLREIPNVRFAHPMLPSISVVRHAALVAVISGTIGLEAAILGKPVLAFGRPAYTALPDDVVTPVHDLWAVPKQVRHALKDWMPPRQTTIETMLAASIDGAVPIDLYSTLLGKAGRYSGAEAAGSTASSDDHLDRLVRYTRARLHDGKGDAQAEPAAKRLRKTS